MRTVDRISQRVALPRAADHKRHSETCADSCPLSSHRRNFRRLTDRASAASEEAKPTNESAARAC